jgi:hypothetical protein
MVARLRGVEFCTTNDGRMYPRPYSDTGGALDDVSQWLGFNAAYDYLTALDREARKILKRAPKPSKIKRK